VLFPRAVDATTRPGTTAFGRFHATGPLSSAYAPFDPSQGEGGAEGFKLRLTRERLDDRRHLHALLDSAARYLETARAVEGVDRLRDQAYRLIEGGLAEAFDLTREDPRLVARYDTAPLVRPDAISKTWKNYNNYVDNAKSLGKLLLLARRLCERGCGFVTVTTNFVWDMHADVNNAPMVEGMRYMGPPLDHALSVLIDDLYARGLQDRVLVVASGEMGRTPCSTPKAGATTGAASALSCWSAAATRRARSSAAPTRTLPRHCPSRSRPAISSVRSSAPSSTWASSGSSPTCPASSPR
jgi:hypothetical protein